MQQALLPVISNPLPLKKMLDFGQQSWIVFYVFEVRILI